jgi:hypothetical protein
MSEIRFGSSRTKPSRHDIKKIEFIAKRYGAKFIESKKDGKYACWFAAPNRGDPFDNVIASAVVDAVRVAKIKLW